MICDAPNAAEDDFSSISSSILSLARLSILFPVMSSPSRLRIFLKISFNSTLLLPSPLLASICRGSQDCSSRYRIMRKSTRFDTTASSSKRDLLRRSALPPPPSNLTSYAKVPPLRVLQAMYARLFLPFLLPISSPSLDNLLTKEDVHPTPIQFKLRSRKPGVSRRARCKAERERRTAACAEQNLNEESLELPPLTLPSLDDELSLALPSEHEVAILEEEEVISPGPPTVKSSRSMPHPIPSSPSLSFICNTFCVTKSAYDLRS
mmetsp:Transcript_2541/g.6343  ORF Transcript_2541/g.6343 Transcript_2541/m.6343 type:complete len:264 (+) Transcript_2541:550-1341(+)